MIADDNTPDIGTVDDDVTDFEQFAVIDDPVTDTEDDEEQQQEADTEADLPEGDDEESDANDADDDSEVEAEAEAEEETDAEDAEDTDEPKPLEDSVTIKMEDGEQITLAELKKGYLRQSDYTRKRQEESQIAQRATQLQQHYAQEIQRAQMVAQAFMPKAPDKALLDYGQTDEYLRQKEAFDQAQQYLGHLQTQQHQVSIQQQKQQEARVQNMRAEALNSLRSEMPELNDPKGRKQTESEIEEMAAALDYTVKDLENVYDKRVIKALIWASKWFQHQKSQEVVRKKVVAKSEKAKPVSQPKRTRKSTRRTDSKQLLKLANDGNERAADALFEQFV